jgi:acylphosphatase
MDLENHLKDLEARIEDCRGRMPAHSAKPGMMEELMDLEDERDRILSEIQQLGK